MTHWRRQQYLDDLKLAQQPCCCENNGDYCEPCQARLALKDYERTNIARDTGLDGGEIVKAIQPPHTARLN